MEWMFLSIICMFTFAALNMTLKVIRTDATKTMFFVLLISSLLLLPFLDRISVEDRRDIPLIILAGILIAISQVLLVRAMRLAPNPGIPNFIAASNALLVYILSAIFLGSEVSVKSLLGGILILVALLLISI